MQRHWRGMPAWIQLLQGLLWAGILGAAALLLPSALEASRPDRSHPGWMPDLTQSVILYSASMLVLSPALIFLVTGSAESIYAVKGFSLRARWSAWRHWRESLRLLEETEEQARDAEQLIEMATALRTRVETERQDIRKKVEAVLTAMPQADLTPQQVEETMVWVEWHAIRDFDGGVLLQRGDKNGALVEESLRTAPARREKVAAMVAKAEDNRQRLKSTSRDLRKAQAELFRAYFETPGYGPGEPPKA